MNSRTPETDAELRNWEGTDWYLPELIHEHMEQSGFRHWVDVSTEADRAWGLMFGSRPDLDSPIDALFSGVAAQAAHGVLCAIAGALGVDPKHIDTALHSWYDPFAEPGPMRPLTPDQFMALIVDAADDSRRTQEVDFPDTGVAPDG